MHPRSARWVILAAFAAVLVAGCDAAPSAAPGSPAAVWTPSDASPEGGADGSGSTGPVSGFRPTGSTESVPVVRVVDGDTIVVRIGGRNERLRYIGMNTPETVKPDTPVEWMGPEASRANAALVGGRTVILERDVSQTDQYGRLLRYVWLHDGGAWTLVNLELVARGFAQVETDPPDVKYADRFLAAERAARAADLGLWGPHPSAGP